jgi:hypothetical protein
MNDFVVNIGHISNECDVIAGSGKPTPDNVKGNPTANMTNMGRSLNRRSTKIYANFATLKGHKIPHGARRSVINP